MSASKLFLRVAAFAVLALFAFLAPASASVSVSAMAVDGSSSLRLQQGEIFSGRAEVRIRVTTTDNKRYQVFQRLQAPLISEKGDTLSLQSLEVQSLPTSNSGGTLYLQAPVRLSPGEELIYTSAEKGQSETFILAYSLRPDNQVSAGRYRGRLTFTARSPGEPDSQASIDLTVETQSGWKVDIGGSRSPSTIYIKDSDTVQTADHVQVSFSGNQGGTVRIYQEVTALPQNESGRLLEEMTVEAVGSRTGLRSNRVEPGNTLLYSSNAGEDSFPLYYLPDPGK